MAHRPTEFAARVRDLRRAAGLSQAELADRADLSERTVSDLERGLRRGVYPATARRLAEALAVEPHELAGFLVLTTASEPNAGSLPRPLTRIVGREADLALVIDLLRGQDRLVTVLGPGGIGKTRLAIEAALVTTTEFPGGSYFVDLSSIDDPGLVLTAIASSVGLRRDTGDLASALGTALGIAPVLLVIDTFEHLAEAAPVVATLLGRCPNLTVLATSRTPLHLRGESQVLLQPLVVSGGDAPAVQLFLDRARKVRPDLRVDPPDRASIAEICGRVDGLPLAIELAAARLKHLSLRDLELELATSLDALIGGTVDAPPRQRTMRAALDWSCRLLADEAVRVLASLTVFRAGFTREAAAAVTGAGTQLPEMLVALVDASLVAVELAPIAGPTRYRMLEVVREHAAGLVTDDERTAIQRRHAEYYATLAERAEPELRGRGQLEWHARLTAEEGNLRAALAWALDHDEGDLALRLAGSLWMFWRWAGLFEEGRRWLERSLACTNSEDSLVRSRALWGAGWLAYHHGDHARSAAVGRELLEHAGAAGEEALWRRNGLTLTGNAALAEGHLGAALDSLTAACDLAEAIGPGWHRATSRLNLGTALLRAGRAGEAKTRFDEALAEYEALGDRHFAARTLIQLGYGALLSESADAAAPPIRRAMAIAVETADHWSLAEGLEAVSALSAERDPRVAIVLASAAERLREGISMQQHPADAVVNARFLCVAIDRLDGEDQERARQEGRKLGFDAIIAIATAS